jgi:hypothetical protein
MIDPKYEIEALKVADHEKGCDRIAYRITRLDVAGRRVPAVEQAWYFRKDVENMLETLQYNDAHGDDRKIVEGQRIESVVMGFIIGTIFGISFVLALARFLGVWNG